MVYAMGGVFKSGSPHLDTVEEYDPEHNIWTPKAPMPTARSELVVVAAPNGKLYAIGGIANGNIRAKVEEYDPVTDTWTTMKSMPVARHGLGGAMVNGKVYAIGGTISNCTSISRVDEYTPPQ